MADERKDCCKQPDNLEPGTPDAGAPPNLRVLVCRVCGCRHFEWDVDPGAVGLEGAGVG